MLFSRENPSSSTAIERPFRLFRQLTQDGYNFVTPLAGKYRVLSDHAHCSRNCCLLRNLSFERNERRFIDTTLFVDDSRDLVMLRNWSTTGNDNMRETFRLLDRTIFAQRPVPDAIAEGQEPVSGQRIWNCGNDNQISQTDAHFRQGGYPGRAIK